MGVVVGCPWLVVVVAVVAAVVVVVAVAVVVVTVAVIGVVVVVVVDVADGGGRCWLSLVFACWWLLAVIGCSCWLL